MSFCEYESGKSQKNLSVNSPEPHSEAVSPPACPVARPLVPVTLALMVGIAAPAWGWSVPEPWLWPMVLALWGAMAWKWWRRTRVQFLPLAFFFLLGVAFYQQAWHPKVSADHITQLPAHQDLTLFGYLSRPAKLAEDRVQLSMKAEAWRSPWGWRPVAGNILVSAPGLARPPVGAGLVVRGRLRSPAMLRNPGTFNRPRYLAADGLFREVRVRDSDTLVFLNAAETVPWGERLRGGIREQLGSLAPTSRAMYLAMLLGDQGEITPEMRRNFARTGTSHLLVINGLHLGAVAAVTFFLSFWLLRRFPWLLLRVNALKIATLLSALPVIFYAWVAGGSPSTQRAEVMILAYLLLVLLGRPGEVWSALALAALVILSLSPLRLFQISFQLSFVAVAALIYLVPRLANLWPGKVKLPRGPMSRICFRAWEWLVVSVVATLATAPLVALYFQVVSLLGFLVNLVAIPLVLLLALPLGEAAVIAQAASLTPVAQGLLYVGKMPLWLAYQVIQWAARVPGSAMVMPTPTWLEIGAYYLILLLVFAHRRTLWTWTGASLATVVLVIAAALPLATVPPALEVTCLDTWGGLEAVLVTPENQRLVLSATVPPWPGENSPGWGPLPGYCHWRQFRRLDLVMALGLNDANAGELRTLAEQFNVRSYWYGRRGRTGPAAVELWNYLGDRGQLPRSLERGRPPDSLGNMDLKFIKMTQATGPAMEAVYQASRVLIIPPGRGLSADDVPDPTGALAVLVLPAELADPRDRYPILRRLHPQQVIVYGDSSRSGGTRGTWPSPCRFTRDGAVSIYLSSGGVTTRQRGP
jgi:ComEC/Rec2-related protein